MKLKIVAVSFACASLASCQTNGTNGKKMEWVQFQPGYVFDVANARCNLYAQQFQQGVYAQGTPGFVLGAQIGNAIGNAIRVSEAHKQCMMIAGWKQVPVQVAKRGTAG